LVACNGRVVEPAVDGVVNAEAAYLDATGVLVVDGEIFELTCGAVEARDEGMVGEGGWGEGEWELDRAPSAASPKITTGAARESWRGFRGDEEGTRRETSVVFDDSGDEEEESSGRREWEMLDEE
jgi:hypothetical protein